MVMAELLMSCGADLAQLKVGHAARYLLLVNCCLGLLVPFAMHSYAHCAIMFCPGATPQREQQPGELYLAAAKAAIERRKVAAFIAGMHGSKAPTPPGRVS